MKRKLTLAAFVILGFTNCKKENSMSERKGNSVIYTVVCESCTAILDTRNGEKQVQVTDFYQLGEINNLKKINITTTGTGKIKTSLKVNDVYLHRVENDQNGNTVTYELLVKE